MLGEFIASISALKRVLEATTFQERARENPEKAVDMLIEFNDDSKIITLARKTSPDDSEWFLNTFQYTRQALLIAKDSLSPDHFIRYSNYFNTSEVFNIVAPRYYIGSTNTQAISPLTEIIPERHGLEVLNILEKKGHLQGIVKANTPDPYMFFKSLAKGYTVSEVKAALKASQSFRLAKENLQFVTNVIHQYPDYVDLVS